MIFFLQNNCALSTRTERTVNHMKVDEAARLLGVTPMTIRIGLQKGVFPFGVAFKLNEHNKNYKYVLYPGKVLEYAGMKGGETDEA